MCPCTVMDQLSVSFRREFAELMDKYGSNSVTASEQISPTQLSTGEDAGALSWGGDVWLLHLYVPPPSSLLPVQGD